MQNIKLFRKKLNITQQHLADLIPCDRTAVAKWESGINKPRPSMLPKIAQALCCSVEDLLDSEDKGGII